MLGFDSAFEDDEWLLGWWARAAEAWSAFLKLLKLFFSVLSNLGLDIGCIDGGG